jgi:hypothetical protein
VNWYEEGVLGDVARAVAATDPDRAANIAQSITNPAAQVSAMLTIVNASLASFGR